MKRGEKNAIIYTSPEGTGRRGRRTGRKRKVVFTMTKDTLFTNMQEASDRFQLFRSLYREARTPEERLDLEYNRLLDEINHGWDSCELDEDQYEEQFAALNAWYEANKELFIPAH